MEEDRRKWNVKHGSAGPASQPAQVVQDHWQLAPAGTALDLACGRGRHALFLAEQGIHVDALDISEVALSTVTHPLVRPQRIDLDNYLIPQNAYSLIVNISFLDRRLFAGILAGLNPGGLLIFQTALADNPHISNPAWKLSPNELLRVFASLRILFYQEKEGIASLVAKQDQ